MDQSVPPADIEILRAHAAGKHYLTEPDCRACQLRAREIAAEAAPPDPPLAQSDNTPSRGQSVSS